MLFGSIPAMRPMFNGTALDMPAIIEILMLCAAAVILSFHVRMELKLHKAVCFLPGCRR